MIKDDVLIDGVALSQILAEKSIETEYDKLTSPSILPPAAGQPVVPPPQGLIALLSAGKRFWFQSDNAVRDSQQNSRVMLRNLSIMEPLQARILCAAEMPHHVEPPNKKDPYQVKIAAELEEIINDIPFFFKYKYALLWGIWFGRAACQNLYSWDWRKRFKRLCVRDWIPINGDSLVYKWDSDAVGLRVGVSASGPGTKTLETENADFSRVHVLSADEREAHTIFTHELRAGDFLDPYSGGNIKGTGIRNMVYWTWYLQNQCLAMLCDYLERMGLGFTVVTFESGNAQAKAAAETIAQAESFSNVITWPRLPGESRSGQTDIYRIEPSLAGVQNFMKLLDEYWGADMRRYIVGQDATSRPMNAGLGSEISSVQESTFFRLVKMDCLNLQECITRELLAIIQKYTFPEARFQCKFVINTEKPNVKEYLEGVDKFVKLGGRVIEAEVRSKLGLGEPQADDVTLGGEPYTNIKLEDKDILPDDVPTLSQEEKDVPFE